MRFPPALLDEIRARLPVSQVVGRKVKLKRQGREYAGLSPFKVEKTASFFVNDQKGFYHCFATGEHGDIFTFVMKTEGLSFPEAIERLAGEAGVTLPKASAEVREQQDVRARLLQLTEAAAVYFERQLASPAGREGQRYLDGRGLTRQTIAKFRLGYAPPGRSALKEHLAAQGFTAAEMNASGMLIHGDDIPVSYDRFRHRVMFPITDLKDRVVAFGGRALEKDAKPKYLNSPETPLFHKGHLLFNAAKARGPAHDRRRVVVVEGYMDAIALSQAGFEESVAPLGTALTADQLGLLWRLDSESILCFDGDGAGQKAAFRAIETALPHLKAGHSLKFAFLPDGLDPDDLLRQQGSAAMSEVLQSTRPLADVLWQREWSAGQWSTPERRAQLEQQVRAKVDLIADTAVRGHYVADMNGRLDKAFGRTSGGGQQPGGAVERGDGWRAQQPRWARQPYAKGGTGGRGGYAPKGVGGRGGAWAMPPSPTASLRQSRLVAPNTASASREALLVRTLLNHPWLIDDWSETIAALHFGNKALATLRDSILEAHALRCPLDRKELRDQLREFGHHRLLEQLEESSTYKGDRFAEADTPRDVVEVGWRHACALHEKQVEIGKEIEAAERAWLSEQSETTFARLRDLNQRLHEAGGKEAIIEGYGEGAGEDA